MKAGLEAKSTISEVFAVGGHLKGIAIELDTIMERHRADVTEQPEHFVGIGAPEPEEVDIARRTHRILKPGGHEHCALEHETVAVAGLCQAVEEPFERVAGQQQVKRLARLPRHVEQARAHRRAHVANLLGHYWAMASR